MNEEVLYSIALTKALPMNYRVQNVLLERFGTAKSVYDNRHSLRDTMPDVSDRLVRALSHMDEYLPEAEKAMLFAQEKGIECILKADSHYPSRLQVCDDAPILIFYRGSANLNTQHTLSMVGTRRCTEHGKKFCHDFLHELQEFCPDTLVISGLAYGIDIAAHRAAMDCGLPTVGVLAHGMEQIYPRSHERDALRMERNGGVLTEHTPYSHVEKVNFLTRNRIVAGMADATIVVESREKGGALITANFANDYNRDVFAVSGRPDDATSAGCNVLISENKASLLNTAQNFALAMRWITTTEKKKPKPNAALVHLTEQEQAVVARLKDTDYGKDMNQLAVETNISFDKLASVLFDLEMNGVVKTLGGGRYFLR